MADTTWLASTSGKTHKTALAGNERFRIVHDPAGTPASQYTEPADMLAWIITQASTWTATQTFSPSTDVIAQYRAANAQTWQLFNTRTDASNGEWLSAAWTSNVMQLTTRANGTGVARALSLGVGAAGQWQINTSGHLLATTDNTYDIGASGATRPRSIYVAGGITAAAATFGAIIATSNNLIVNSNTNNIYFGTTASVAIGYKASGRCEINNGTQGTYRDMSLRHFAATGAEIDFTALPTADPGVVGRLYRTAGAVMVSI